MNDILDKSIFTCDQRELVLKAIRRIVPEFEPKYTAPTITYTNSLVAHLNKSVQPIEENLDQMVSEHNLSI